MYRSRATKVKIKRRPELSERLINYKQTKNINGGALSWRTIKRIGTLSGLCMNPGLARAGLAPNCMHNRDNHKVFINTQHYLYAYEIWFHGLVAIDFGRLRIQRAGLAGTAVLVFGASLRLAAALPH